MIILRVFIFNYLLAILVCASSFFAIFFLINLYRSQQKDYEFWLSLLHAFLLLPGISILLILFAAAVGSTFITNRMAKSNQFITIIYFGITRIRLFALFFAPSIILIPSLLLISEFVLQPAAQTALRLGLEGTTELAQPALNRIWLKKNQHIISVRQLDPVNQVLYDIAIYEFDQQQENLLASYNAEYAKKSRDNWQLYDGQALYLQATETHKTFSSLQSPVELSKFIGQQHLTPPEMSMRNILSNINYAQKYDQPTYVWSSELWRRILDILLVLVAVLLGPIIVPLGKFRTGNEKGVYLVAAAIGASGLTLSADLWQKLVSTLAYPDFTQLTLIPVAILIIYIIFKFRTRNLLSPT